MNSILKVTTGAVVAFVAGAVVTTTAQAAGFEKSIIFGGRSAGLAGIATPYMEGADALYFNPAGLVGEKVGNTLSFNLSPTSSQFKGPINNQNDQVSSASKMLLPFGLMFNHTMNEDWGFGAGVFVSGGSNATFEAISFPSSNYAPDVKTDLRILEASAGVGYRATENLKFGLAWRVVMAQADFSFVQRASPTLVANAKLTGLKDTQALAFRAGAQYKASESTTVGLTFRSEVNIVATGKSQTTVFSSAGGGGTVAAEQDATARTTFPMSITLGAMHKLSDEWNLFEEYAWTQYSRIGEITVESASFSTSGGMARLKTAWNDQHNFRVGAEYLMAWPVRFGYGLTNVVSNPEFARASFTPPALAHTLTVGTGKAFTAGEGADSNLRLDGAFEYTMSSGDASNATAAGTTGAGTDTRAGTYAVSAYALHLNLAYMF